MYENKKKLAVLLSGFIASLGFAAVSWSEAMHIEVKLSGNESVPAVESPGSGEGMIVVDEQGNISGSITTQNVPATMAHIHQAPAGTNGPVAIPLEQTGDGTWSVPKDTQLTEAQYESLKKGDLYINVHTEAHPAGEVRGQLKSEMTK